MRHPKILPSLVFRKRANHKSRNAQPQSEREPQNEARFADCAIFGERRLVINAEVALAFLGKTTVKISGENRPYGLYGYGLYSYGLYSYGLYSYGLERFRHIVMAYIVLAYILFWPIYS